jgi:dTDP-4-dehydrorhamnose reductase
MITDDTESDRYRSPTDMDTHAKVRVLITGASGWLGQFVWERFTKDYAVSPLMMNETCHLISSSIQLYGTYANNKPSWIPDEQAKKMDVQVKEDIQAVMMAVKPDLIIHLAAISFPDICEKDPVKGDRINCPTQFIEVIKSIVPEVRMIFTSSALVYDGEHAPYQTNFNTSMIPPICEYGKSKLKAENLILEHIPKSCVLRLSNLLGPSCVYRHGELKFMEWLYGVFKKRKYIDFRYDEIRSFVYVNDVVTVISNITSAVVNEKTCSKDEGVGDYCNQYSRVDLSKVYGQIFNIGGPRGLSRLSLASMVAEACGVEVQIGNAYIIILRY